MARPIVLSNGQMHVGINEYGLVHDFYYPYVGGENHASATRRHKIGVYIDGEISWLDDSGWRFSMQYINGALISHTTASNDRLNVVLEFTDTVVYDEAAFVRSIHVVNASEQQRTIKLYCHQMFTIAESKRSDTIQFLPDEHGLLHYKGRRYFVVGGTHHNQPFDDYAIGLTGIEGKDSVARDAEDGHLSNNNVEHGSVDSIIGYTLDLPGHESTHVQYWVAAGRTLQEALALHKDFATNSISAQITKTHREWHEWLEIAQRSINKVEQRHQHSMTDSVLLVKSHIDSHGGVVASTDTTMLNYSRDSYAYCWPRDGVYALWPLLRMGYKQEIEAFFAYTKRTMNDKGYVMHKYAPDGAIGSSWHPYNRYGDKTIPPIQEDETALVVFLFGRFCAMYQKDTILEQYYDSMIKPMADFMVDFIDPKTKLPYPTYDLWERLFLTTTYTTALVYAALMEAVALAESSNHHDDAVRWRETAESIYDNRDIFYDKDTKSFIKGFISVDGSIQKDTTIDISSVYGAYMFGLYAVDSQEVEEGFETARQALTTSESHPGLARFQDDEYDRSDPSRVGNPWYITTLWMAQYYFEKGNVEAAHDIMQWVQSRMLSTSVLSEQFDAVTLDSISVAPLTWSQAEYINCLLDSIHHGD